ncbi:hypothetical protein HA466_0292500 [Hirschfeldia incana]|nr:hypothetical protein HA466_0292500 [Hirschfeldia incana]
MGRSEIAKVPMLLLRSWKHVQGRAGISSKAAKQRPMVIHYSEGIFDHRVQINCGGEEEWVPHPRTGIFFPPGQEESVMDGVPDGAASFDMTFWLRNVDGVDKPDPDHHFPS